MQKSESTTNIFPAFIKAQAEIKAVTANAVNESHNSPYADLDAVVDAIREVAPKYDLGYSQLYEPSIGKEVRLTTIIMHESGEWFGSTMTIPAFATESGTGIELTSAQMYGASGTYGRRYALSAAFGITQRDRDGEGLRLDDKGIPDEELPPAPDREDMDPAFTKKLKAAKTKKLLIETLNSLPAAERKPYLALYADLLVKLNKKPAVKRGASK